MLIWFGFAEGMQIAWWVFVGAAIFDWQMAEYIFPQQKCDDCESSFSDD